jgi:hypothetical protein
VNLARQIQIEFRDLKKLSAYHSDRVNMYFNNIEFDPSEVLRSFGNLMPKRKQEIKTSFVIVTIEVTAEASDHDQDCYKTES